MMTCAELRNGQKLSRTLHQRENEYDRNTHRVSTMGSEARRCQPRLEIIAGIR